MTEYRRDTNYIEDRIVADPERVRLLPAPPRSSIGSLGYGLPEGAEAWPVEARRYRLIAAPACPWAGRVVIVRRLLGLEDAISLGRPGPTHDERSWNFSLDPDGRDPVLGIERLQDAYLKRFPGYPRGITTPSIVDISSGEIVTNNYPQMTLDLSTEWREHHREGAPDLLPEDSRDEMWQIIERIFNDVNNGVYRCGFAKSQEAYDKAYRDVWEAMDWLNDLLAKRRFLLGPSITEADVRLFTTLARFDVAYHGHFKVNRNKLSEMKHLWGYARELFQTPGFGDTTDFTQIKQHFYLSHKDLNPSGIIPAGPDLTNWLEPHDRDRLGGAPFGEGTPPEPEALHPQI